MTQQRVYYHAPDSPAEHTIIMHGRWITTWLEHEADHKKAARAPQYLNIGDILPVPHEH